MRSVRVEWEGPFSIEEVLELNHSEDDYGLYQIYGRHILFGADSLLYIGKAEGVTFKQRFNQHCFGKNEKWLLEEEGVSIHVGRIVRKIMSMILQIGQIGVKFSGMQRHLQSTGTHHHINQWC